MFFDGDVEVIASLIFFFWFINVRWTTIEKADIDKYIY